MPEAERIDRRRAALIAYDVCRRALTPSDPARRAAMSPVLDAWVQMIAAARAVGVPVIYTTPVSRADGADVIMLPTDLSAETGVLPLTNAVEGTPEASRLKLAALSPASGPAVGLEAIQLHRVCCSAYNSRYVYRGRKGNVTCLQIVVP